MTSSTNGPITLGTDWDRLDFEAFQQHQTKFLEPYSNREDKLPFKPPDISWRLAMPKRSGDKRLSLSSISHFYALQAVDFNKFSQRGADAWARLLNIKKGKRRVNLEEKEHAIEVIGSSFYAITLENMQEAASPEVGGDFPVAKINWFEVYMTRTGFLEKLGSPVTPFDGRPGPKERQELAISGVGFVECFLNMVDKEARTKTGRKTLSEKAWLSIELTRGAFDVELKGKTTADYVWQV